MTKAIWFDMDGTIADLYGVDGWLPKLIASDPTPYEEAKPLLKMQPLARLLNALQRKGYQIGIVSWLSKGGTDEYGEAVKEAKLNWLHKHLKSVNFDKIDFMAHGTPKQIGRDGILFDDEEKNRNEWNGIAYNTDNIMGILKAL